MRGLGPFKNKKSLMFASYNRGKLSISLNLKKGADKLIFEQLLATADVLVENFRPGVLANLGYPLEILHKQHPRLIYACVSGFGHSGPYKERPAYDLIAQGAGGLMSVTGFPNMPPARAGVSIADAVPSMLMFGGISTALYARTQTGKGTMVDVSMMDTVISLLEENIPRYYTEGESPGPNGNRHSVVAPFGTFKSKDGYVNIVGQGFEQLCEVLGDRTISSDPRFKRNKLRVRNADVLYAKLEQLTAKKTTKEWIKLLSQHRIPVGPVNTVEQVVKDPHVAARNMLPETQDEQIENMKLFGRPIKFSEYPDPPTRPKVPDFDEHRDIILQRLSEKSKL